MRCLVLGMILLAGCASKPELNRYRVPDGFVVEEAAGPEQAGGAAVFTFDSLGRPTVARNGQSPVILEDRNGDGRFETEKVFTRAFGNVRGMWWDGRTLYAASGDAGLYRCPDADGDDIADSCSLVSARGPRTIRRGIDGEAMVMSAGVPAEVVDANSPLAKHGEAGEVLTRLNRKSGKFLVIGGGLRQVGDFAVHPEGDAFALDSEADRARLLQVAAGGNYGSGAEYNMDTLPGMRALARGAAAGMEFYTSAAYPDLYRNALFEAVGDGVLVSKPAKCGGAWCAAGPGKEFVHGPVTGIAVGPDGNLWFSAAEGLFRVVYRPGMLQRLYAGSAEAEGMLAVVRQAQGLSSWGHAALLAAKGRMGEAAWKNGLWAIALDKSQTAGDRVNALLILDRTGPRATAELLRPLAQDGAGAVRAAAVLVASFHSSPRAKAIVAGGLNDVDPFVRRRALEGLVRMGLNGETHETFAPVNVVYEGLNDPDRAVRYAARVALERYPRATWAELALREKSGRAAPEAYYALTRTATTSTELDALFPLELELLGREGLTSEQRLNALRVLQLTAARREGGAPEAVRAEAQRIAAPLLSSGDERLSRELTRVLASLTPSL